MIAPEMIAQAFANTFNPMCLFLIWFGTVIGIIFGSIPGLSATMAVVLFLPLTFGMETTQGLALLCGLYMGGISGGLISAILLKIPGTPSSISTVFDGGPMAERGEALTSDSLSEIYGRLNSEYHGKSMDCDDLISLEWMRIPHFYTAFYVYKYATGFSCAEAIVKDILNSGDAGRYRDFLRLGGSMLPLDELKKAGVDLESGKPVSDCMEAFRSALEDFKKLN